MMSTSQPYKEIKVIQKKITNLAKYALGIKYFIDLHETLYYKISS